MMMNEFIAFSKYGQSSWMENWLMFSILSMSLVDATEQNVHPNDTNIVAYHFPFDRSSCIYYVGHIFSKLFWGL